MSNKDDTQVVVLGHGLVVDEMRHTLSDMATLGRLKQFMWIDTVSDVFSPAVRMIGSYSAEPLLTIDAALREVRGTVLVVALEEITNDPAETSFSQIDRWLAEVENRVAGRVSRIRMLLPRLPHPTHPPIEREGWSTIALAPEDSDSPVSSLSPLYRASDPSGAAEVFAPALSSLCGLWRSSTTIPVLDDTGHAISTGPKSAFRLARAYHRTIDASQLEDQLVRRVVDISEQLPLTAFRDGRYTVFINDPAEVARRYTTGIIAKHEANLTTVPQAEKHVASIRQDGFAAVKSFIREFSLAVFGTPRRWADSIKGTVTDNAASAIQRGLYGEKSVVEVVVGSSSGRPASMTQLREQSHSIQQQVQRNGFTVEPEPSLSMLWQDYTEAAVTLVDGAERLDGELAGPRDNNSNPMIARRPGDVVPDTSQAFNGYHPILKDLVGMNESDAHILPFDVYRARVFENELTYVATQSTDSSIIRIREDFAQWRQRHSSSFAWAMGNHLLERLDTARSRVGESWSRLQAIQADVATLHERDYEKENRALAMKLRMLSFIWLPLFLVLTYFVIRYYKPDWRFFLASWPGIDWRWYVLLLLIITGVILGTQMAVFMSARRGIIDGIERKRLLLENHQICSQNYCDAIQDVTRLTGAYLQFLSWNTIIGRVLERPFGKPDESSKALSIPTAGLPRSTQLGRAVAGDSDMTELVNEVRSEFFGPGWAGAALQSFVDDTFTEMKRAEGTNPTRMAELFGQPGSGTNSILDQVANYAVSERLEDRNRIADKWLETINNRSVTQRIEQAVNTVEFYENNTVKTSSRDDFLSPLHDFDPVQSRFSNACVNAAGVSRNATSIDTNLSTVDVSGTASNNLNQSVTVTQFSPSVPLVYLVGESQAGLDPTTVVFDAEQATAQTRPDSLLTEGKNVFPDFDGLV
ncbi:hypothetical protein CMUST_13670 [Corynebacterium mustelae]|uniref:Uncharacterized protein n=1 Tax=Corynebacterium mustelae TaxID=571915 RepID=A0A0G3H5C4_9CORY|nr:hypothetical protein [Corynebacterium mustelae]AKK07028.1 hypothetical protein CMUST_13670 [Corynebacterium mustelae]